MAHNSSDPTNRQVWSAPTPADCILTSVDPELPATVRYGLPASWEDCLILGLDPLTGQAH
jgi:hypothetical protein